MRWLDVPSLAAAPRRGVASDKPNGALARVRHVFLDDLGVAVVQNARPARGLDELRSALDHAVTLARLAGFDFAGAGHLEALFSARLGFHFRHFALCPYNSIAAPQ
jgi:hypothetical protein